MGERDDIQVLDRPAPASLTAMQITWRPVVADDIPTWAALLADVEEVDRTAEIYDEDDLREELADDTMSADDRIAGFDGDQMVAYAGVRSRVGDFVRVDGEGCVHPRVRGQGLGTHLVAWTLERARQVAAERDPGRELRVHLHASAANRGQVELFEELGFPAVNWSATMRISLADAPAPAAPEFAPGLIVHRYDPRWSAAVLDAHNTAFADHWGFAPWSPEMWRQHVDESKNFRPGSSWVVVDERAPDRVVGYVQSNEYEAYEAATGRREAYLAKIGVRREARGKGLATALLRLSLGTYRAQGYDESALDVDTSNPTGAFGLYERAGYRVEHRTATHELVEPSRVTVP